MTSIENTERPNRGAPIGTILIRLIVPCWVLVGAGIKLYTRNPNLLPEPLLEVIRSMGNLFGVEDPGWWLGISFRTLIGAEIALALIMLFAPRLARAAASFVLAIFIAVLVATMAMAARRDGISAIWSGSCGCFGSASPPPIIMFAIDAILLVGVIVFRPIREHPKGSPWLTVLGAILVGFSVAFLVPDKTITYDPSSNSIDTSKFGPMPTALEPNYFTTFSNWVGSPLASHPLAKIISRPLPDWINTGRFHLVYYREDCEHCHDLLENFFAGPLDTPTIAVKVPDHDPNNAMSMPCDECLMHELPSGPNYIITTPILLTVENGTVLSVCEDPEDHAKVMDTINAAAPSLSTDLDEDTTQSSATEASDAWGPMPQKLEPYYFPEFENWIGTSLASHPFAKLIGRPVPDQFKSGTGFLIFYRADCEHCHEMLERWFTQSLPGPTLAVVVPDTEPDSALHFPSTLVERRSLPKGPDYVMTTPALLTIVDGVVKCYAHDPEDTASVEACLKAK